MSYASLRPRRQEDYRGWRVYPAADGWRAYQPDSASNLRGNTLEEIVRAIDEREKGFVLGAL